jgi:cell division septum initiation protein DivIVA
MSDDNSELPWSDDPDEPHPLEDRVKELLEEAEAVKDLERRIEELEKNLQAEKQRNSAAINQLVDQETKVKELLIQVSLSLAYCQH